MRLRHVLPLLMLAASWPGTSNAQRLHGTTRGDRFESTALGVTKHFVVYLPPSYERTKSKRYPVAYYLHGLSGRESDWVSVGAIDAVADSLIAAGMAETIIVMPDGDDGWYSKWVNPLPYGTCRDSLLREAPERTCVKSFAYDDYIARDLVAYVDSHYRTIADRRHRGIGGLSMGGYGAMKLAFAYPEVFAAAASHSGAISRMLVSRPPNVLPPRYATAVDTLLRGYFATAGIQLYGRDLATWQANDPSILASRLKDSRRPIPALYFDVGTSDGLLGENQAFDYELTRLGIAHTYREFPGAHTWRYWNTHVRESLPWMVGIIGH
jgi:S-formylglutathione hydrolase FrmB